MLPSPSRRKPSSRMGLVSVFVERTQVGGRRLAMGPAGDDCSEARVTQIGLVYSPIAPTALTIAIQESQTRHGGPLRRASAESARTKVIHPGKAMAPRSWGKRPAAGSATPSTCYSPN